MNRSLTLAALLAAALTANHAQAQGLQFGGGTRTYTASPGSTIPVGQHYAIQWQGCRPAGIPSVEVFRAPTSGSVELVTVNTRVAPDVRDTHGRSLDAFNDCIGQPIPAVEVRYTAGAARGTDYLSYQLVFPGGGIGRVDITIRVR